MVSIPTVQLPLGLKNMKLKQSRHISDLEKILFSREPKMGRYSVTHVQHIPLFPARPKELQFSVGQAYTFSLVKIIRLMITYS